MFGELSRALPCPTPLQDRSNHVHVNEVAIRQASPTPPEQRSWPTRWPDIDGGKRLPMPTARFLKIRCKLQRAGDDTTRSLLPSTCASFIQGAGKLVSAAREPDASRSPPTQGPHHTSSTFSARAATRAPCPSAAATSRRPGTERAVPGKAGAAVNCHAAATETTNGWEGCQADGGETISPVAGQQAAGSGQGVQRIGDIRGCNADATPGERWRLRPYRSPVRERGRRARPNGEVRRYGFRTRELGRCPVKPASKPAAAKTNGSRCPSSPGAIRHSTHDHTSIGTGYYPNSLATERVDWLHGHEAVLPS